MNASPSLPASPAAAHTPVMRDAAVAALKLRADSLVIDATYGRGGHARAIIRELGDGGRLLLIDRDAAAIEHANAQFGDDARVEVIHARFAQLGEIIRARGIDGRVAALLFDVGVSSPQLDSRERGFGFDGGALDMRMDRTRGKTAADFLARIDEAELARVLRRFGEERYAGRIARAIKTKTAHAPIQTANELAETIARAVPRRQPGKHPATRSFLALRIAVNDELGELRAVLPQALAALQPGGRLVVISFHSLEDRMVKRFMRDQSRGDWFPPDWAAPESMKNPTLKRIGKAMRADDDEVARNRRARSAVMRVAEKLTRADDVR